MIKRTIEAVIKETSHTFAVLFITGPRGVGKAETLKRLAEKKRTYVSLDDLDLRHMAQSDPGLFIQVHPPPIIIDEVQYAPNLLSYIKMVVDREKTNGLYWLTGSQKFHLMRGITESLAGRVGLIDLLGLSQAERARRGNSSTPFMPTASWIQEAKQTAPKPLPIAQVFEHIWQGSFPRLYQKEGINRERFYQSYIATYIQRDVKDILNISDETTFLLFLRAMAARTGGLLNLAGVARDVGVDQKTIKKWLSVLETSGLVYLLQPYHSNLTKRLVKTPKLYFLDTGLCAYLTKWPTPESLEAGAMSGAILETFVFSEILKSYWHNGIEPHLHYYRDTDQKEVDLIIETGDGFFPIEIKKTATPSQTASRHFHVLTKLGKPIKEGAVLCFVKDTTALARDIWAIPIGYL